MPGKNFATLGTAKTWLMTRTGRSALFLFLHQCCHGSCPLPGVHYGYKLKYDLEIRAAEDDLMVQTHDRSRWCLAE